MADLTVKIQRSIALIQKAEKLALTYSEKGFYVNFSGGKDSIVVLELVRMSGVKHKVHMQLTSLDPPELLRYVHKEYPEVILHRPPITFYRLIVKKGMLPLRQVRYCCQYLKEFSGVGFVNILGIRKEESSKRRNRKELEINKHKYSNSLDQFNIDFENKVICVQGKDKILLSPIIDWSTSDVWNFIRSKKLKYCELYDKGYTRIGCIFCPMSSVKSKLRDRQNFPKIEKLIKRSIAQIVKDHDDSKVLNGDVDDIFNWWISDKSIKEYTSIKNKPKFF